MTTSHNTNVQTSVKLAPIKEAPMVCGLCGLPI